VLWLYEDRDRLAPAQCHRRFVDPHRDRVTAEQALMQDLHSGAFDKPQLDQPPLEFGGRETVIAALDANRPDLPSRSDHGSAERHDIMRFMSSDASALTRVSIIYCDSLSVATNPLHGWYRIACGADTEDVPSEASALPAYVCIAGFRRRPAQGRARRLC